MKTHKKQVNEIIDKITINDINDGTLNIPDDNKLTYLHFRRFAGCPLCNLQVHSLFKNAEKLAKANIRCVIVFNSSQERIFDKVINLDDFVAPELQQNFNIVADPNLDIYKSFGVDGTFKSLLHPKIIFSGLRGLRVKAFAPPEKLSSELVVPADFLLDQQGKIMAMHYGKHGDDQWSVKKLLSLVS